MGFQRIQLHGLENLKSQSTEKLLAQHKVTDGQIELAFDGIVGDPWEESASSDIRRILRDQPNAAVRVSINSPGGAVWDGVAIYNLLASHEGPVTVQIEGEAGSISSVIAMAGDSIRMFANASIWIHRAWTIALGNVGDMEAISRRLAMVDRQLASVYAARTGGTTEAWLAHMAGPEDQDGTWFAAEEALEAGLIDSIIPLKQPAKSDDENCTPPAPKAGTVGEQQPKENAEAVAVRAKLVRLDA